MRLEEDKKAIDGYIEAKTKVEQISLALAKKYAIKCAYAILLSLIIALLLVLFFIYRPRDLSNVENIAGKILEENLSLFTKQCPTCWLEYGCPKQYFVE